MTGPMGGAPGIILEISLKSTYWLLSTLGCNLVVGPIAICFKFHELQKSKENLEACLLIGRKESTPQFIGIDEASEEVEKVKHQIISWSIYTFPLFGPTLRPIYQIWYDMSKEAKRYSKSE